MICVHSLAERRLPPSASDTTACPTFICLARLLPRFRVRFKETYTAAIIVVRDPSQTPIVSDSPNPPMGVKHVPRQWSFAVKQICNFMPAGTTVEKAVIARAQRLLSVRFVRTVNSMSLSPRELLSSFRKMVECLLKRPSIDFTSYPAEKRDVERERPDNQRFHRFFVVERVVV